MIDECEGCEFTTELEEYEAHHVSKLKLCAVCSHTFIGSVIRYPAQYSSGVRQTLQAINWGTNRILSEIEKMGSTENAK